MNVGTAVLNCKKCHHFHRGNFCISFKVLLESNIWDSELAIPSGSRNALGWNITLILENSPFHSLNQEMGKVQCGVIFEIEMVPYPKFPYSKVTQNLHKS